MNDEYAFRVLGIKVIKDLPLRNEIAIIGIINGFFVYRSSSYWVVRGKIPLGFADELYKFRDSLGIRVGGNTNSAKPIEWCTSDEFEEYKDEQHRQVELIGMAECSKNVQNKKIELMNEKLGTFYVSFYHIDKLEGLYKVINVIKDNDIMVKR